MKLGTRSLLFGVHQCLFHPLTVGLAWHRLYGEFPKWWECVAILLHDVGYWGQPNMDGPEGRQHPVKGAELTRKAVKRLYLLGARLRHPFIWRDVGMYRYIARHYAREYAHKAWELAIGHSRYYAAESGVPLSKLFRADKVSLLFDPQWFYLLRAWLSGEVFEYVSNAPEEVRARGLWGWASWYRNLVSKRWL